MTYKYNCTNCKINHRNSCTFCINTIDENPTNIDLYEIENLSSAGNDLNSTDCYSCRDTIQSIRCNLCDDCNLCIDCEQCDHCDNCYACTGSKYCDDCELCSYCKYCCFCSNCNNCKNCKNMCFVNGISDYNIINFQEKYKTLEKNVRWIIETKVLNLIIMKRNDMKFIDKRITISGVEEILGGGCYEYECLSFMVCMEDIVIMLIEEFDFDIDLFPKEVIKYINKNKSVKSARK